ncbi:DUF6615 family protein [Methylobacterium gossipiicola]|uniref:Uncharacterized protein n=1 Tax=Methylobacterium gossipiicola TaxID=582675 RepID=A0A1I2XRL2_9HYPH|nr:DUF6615 family protein [Methylobacterium gossipiicola]SFH15719.1 hypothetical protein SAMN05192565_1631 [Methylobacterium gossipiicola]
MTQTLCDLASSLPGLIGIILDRESKLKRGRFREETLTDVFVAALAAFAGPELVIQYPHEATTGGDLDLEFWHVETGRRILLRLQAKRLNALHNGDKLVSIHHRSYRELLHVVNSTGEYQFKTLVDTSGPYLPLYIFYNHASVSADPYYALDAPQVSGINLAFAFDIEREMQAKIDAKPSVLHHKRLSHLRPFFFELKDILCPGSHLAGLVPTPDAVSDKLRDEWRRPRLRGRPSDDSERMLRYLSEAPSLRPSRDPRQRLPDGPAIRTSAAVERDTITFISGRTEDERTPRIIDPRHPRRG